MKKIKEYQLRQKQSLSLDLKTKMSKNRIREFYNYTDGNIYVSFSGGKDSTVLLDIVRSIYPKTPAVFCDTGLEYPEIKDFVKTFDNVTIIRPKMNFRQVLKKHGYPIISKDIAHKLRKLQNPNTKNKKTRNLYATGEKNYGKDGKDSVFKLSDKYQKKFKIKFDEDIGWYSDFDKFKISEQCCDVMKKKPFHKYEEETGLKPIIGTMASDSRQRMYSYLNTGCNSLKGSEKSRPLSFWLEKDVWDYIHKNKLPYSCIYDKGIDRTGCIFCMFGVHMEKRGKNRFQCLKLSHPELWDYCINKLGLREVLDFLEIPYLPKTKNLLEIFEKYK